jgi:hypothetical protein
MLALDERGASPPWAAEPTVCVLPVCAAIENVWAVATEHLERACRQSDGELRLDDIRRRAIEGDAQVWMVFRGGEPVGAVVTELCDREGWVNLVAAQLRYTGEDTFGVVLRQLGEWAAGFGSRLCGFSRRPGMGRLLARYGWRPRFVEYVAP